MSIRIFYDDISFRVKSWRKLKKLIEKVIAEEKKIPGDLNFILTTDDILKSINIEFLKHNYFTDVICFDCCEGKIVSGEIFVSVDTVKINSKNYKVSYNSEIRRVIIHGLLHLCGYDDKNENEREVMRNREDYWLLVYNKI